MKIKTFFKRKNKQYNMQTTQNNKTEEKQKNNSDTKKIKKRARKIKKPDKDSLQAINELISLAKEYIKKDKKLSDRYVFLARKIAMSQQIRLPSELKKQFCKHCYSYLLPGFNCKVRVSNNCVIYHCPYCNKMGKIRIK